MSRSEYIANKDLANSEATDTKPVKHVPAGYVTGPIIRSENEKPAVKLGDVNDPSTWEIV